MISDSSSEIARRCAGPLPENEGNNAGGLLPSSPLRLDSCHICYSGLSVLITHAGAGQAER